MNCRRGFFGGPETKVEAKNFTQTMTSGGGGGGGGGSFKPRLVCPSRTIWGPK